VSPILDRRPIVVALAGPNGAGKTTFYHAHLKAAGLRLVNADVLARELQLDPYAAAQIAAAIRRQFITQRESFVFETVFSDPVGDKLAFLKDLSKTDYTVVLCFVGLSRPATAVERVAMRVLQGGHDVPTEKLLARFPRTLHNLSLAIRELPFVFVYDNEDLRTPFRRVAEFEHGQPILLAKPLPDWFSVLV